MSNSAHSFRPAPSRGMSLIEILVGLAIGLIGMLIMFQMFVASAERNRSTSSGNDAQIAGAIGLYQMERDIKEAGLGFGLIPIKGKAGGVAGCAVSAYNSNLATPVIPDIKLAPVEIIQANGVPDQLVVLHGNPKYFVLSRKFGSSTATSKTLVNRGGFNNGDILLVTDMGTDDTGQCALVEVTGTAGSDLKTVDHLAAGTHYASFPSGTDTVATMNPPGGVNVAGGTGYAYNLGQAPARTVWRVTPAGAASPNQLVMRDSLHSETDVAVTDGIVDLRAQYGVDADANGQIADTEWVRTVPDDWSRVLAVRFALLARSQQYEKAAVTTTAPRWSGGDFAMANLDGSTGSPGGVSDWRHYRYRVYETIVPLRNMIWGTAP